MTTPGPAPGDLLPPLMVQADGRRATIYARHRGRRLLLCHGDVACAVAAATATELDAEVLPLARAGTAPLEPYATVDAGLAAALGIAGADLLLLADHDLRLLVRQPLAGVDVAVEARRLVEAARAASADPSQGSVGMAPVLRIPRVLDAGLCAEVLSHFHAVGARPSGVLVIENGQQRFELDPTVKMRHETVIQDPALEARVHACVGSRVLPMIERAFAFAVQRREPFKIIRYKAGAGYFRAHRDNDTPDVAHRRFAMTLNLNTGAYQGGCLRFPEFGDVRYEAPAGGALIFSCSLLHEVTDLVEGERYAMTSFFS
jgi:predicted 2-oxoglutarate/Fe(II)-dependent dioxygenase YbiX